MTETSTAQPGLLHRLVIRLLLVAVLMSAVTAIWWVITGQLAPGGARVLLNGVGLGIFGVFGLAAQHAGRRASSWFARVGPVADLVGAVLWFAAVWFDAWNVALWAHAIGVAFFVSFAGMRGALISAADVSAYGQRFKTLALAAVSLTMALGVLVSTVGLGALGWRLFGVGSIVEMAAVVAVLVFRAPPKNATDPAKDEATEKKDPL